IGQGTRLAGAHDGNDFEARKITPSRRLLNREDAEAGKGDERKRREQIIAARCAHVEPGDDLSGPQTWKRVVSNRPPASSGYVERATRHSARLEQNRCVRPQIVKQGFTGSYFQRQRYIVKRRFDGIVLF